MKPHLPSSKGVPTEKSPFTTHFSAFPSSHRLSRLIPSYEPCISSPGVLKVFFLHAGMVCFYGCTLLFHLCCTSQIFMHSYKKVPMHERILESDRLYKKLSNCSPSLNSSLNIFTNQLLYSFWAVSAQRGVCHSSAALDSYFRVNQKFRKTQIDSWGGNIIHPPMASVHNRIQRRVHISYFLYLLKATPLTVSQLQINPTWCVSVLSCEQYTWNSKI